MTCNRKATAREQYTTAKNKTPLVSESTYNNIITSGCDYPTILLWRFSCLCRTLFLYYTVTAAATTINRPNLQRYVTGRFPRPRVSVVPSIEVMYEIRISNPSSIFRVSDNLEFEPNSRAYFSKKI